jgi:hypothetical protein
MSELPKAKVKRKQYLEREQEAIDKERERIIAAVVKAVGEYTYVSRIKYKANRDLLLSYEYVLKDVPANDEDFHSTAQTKIEW